MLPGLLAAGAALTVVAAVGLAVGAPPPPTSAGRVRIEDLDGPGVWIFDACVDLGSSQNVVRTLGVPEPAELFFLDLECRRGITPDTSLWSWRELIEQGDLESATRRVRVRLGEGAGGDVASWEAATVWPSRVQAVLEDDRATEHVRLVMGGLTRVAPPPPTPTPPPSGGLPFTDGFESGDLSAWSGP